MPIADLDRGLAMRQHAEQSIDRQMQQHVNDDGNHERQHQRVSIAGAGAGDDSSKWLVERIRHCDNELYKPGAAPGLIENVGPN